MNELPPQDSWKLRRRLIFGAAIFSAVIILLVILRGPHDSVGETAITMAFGTLISVVGTYAFGATWEYSNRLRGGKE